MYQFVKRFFDIVLCAFAVVVLSPIYLLTAIGIELSSPGTILYHSMRAGLHKKPFKFFKFRSMHPPKGKKKDMFTADPDRLFAFGKLIRRLKIDELPQSSPDSPVPQVSLIIQSATHIATTRHISERSSRSSWNWKSIMWSTRALHTTPNWSGERSSRSSRS